MISHSCHAEETLDTWFFKEGKAKTVQTMQMQRLICVFAGYICHNVQFLMLRLTIFSLFFSFAGDGVLICSIDNMPAQMPREATDFFGSLLLPYIPEIVMYLSNYTACVVMPQILKKLEGHIAFGSFVQFICLSIHHTFLVSKVS